MWKSCGPTRQQQALPHLYATSPDTETYILTKSILHCLRVAAQQLSSLSNLNSLQAHLLCSVGGALLLNQGGLKANTILAKGNSRHLARDKGKERQRDAHKQKDGKKERKKDKDSEREGREGERERESERKRASES